MDRAVLLNDITKIARLALKFPLSFVDLPACAYALFHGLRSAESAQWCAENFHKKLLPSLAERLVPKSVLPFTMMLAILVLVLGERIVLAGVGDVRAVLLPEKGALQEVLACTGSLDAAELERVSEAHGIFRDGLVYSSIEGVDEAARILAARSSFEVLQVEQGSSLDLKQPLRWAVMPYVAHADLTLPQVKVIEDHEDLGAHARPSILVRNEPPIIDSESEEDTRIHYAMGFS
eukprot:g5185.t1